MPRDPRPAVSSWRRLRRLRWTALAAAGAVAAALAACGRAAPPPQPDEATAEIVRLQRRVATLERQAELAGGKEFYLILDTAGAELSLMLRGAELRRFPVLRQSVAYPRVSWIRRGAVSWQGVVWSEGALVPPRPIDRVVMNADPPGAGGEEPEPPRIPPTAEELYRIPARYHIRFTGGLAIEIRPGEADQSEGRLRRFGRWWIGRWTDVAAALGTSAHDRVRLRLVLARADAESLYRSLPPSVRLLVPRNALPPVSPQSSTSSRPSTSPPR